MGCDPLVCSPQRGFGDIGCVCIKISAVECERWIVEAPAAVFNDQADVLAALRIGNFPLSF